MKSKFFFPHIPVSRDPLLEAPALSVMSNLSSSDGYLRKYLIYISLSIFLIYQLQK